MTSQPITHDTAPPRQNGSARAQMWLAAHDEDVRTAERDRILSQLALLITRRGGDRSPGMLHDRVSGELAGLRAAVEIVNGGTALPAVVHVLAPTRTVYERWLREARRSPSTARWVAWPENARGLSPDAVVFLGWPVEWTYDDRKIVESQFVARGGLPEGWTW